MQLLVYTNHLSSRANYIFQHLLGEILGIDFKITQQIDEFKTFNGYKISYTDAKVDEELHFKSTPLLFETGIKQQHITSCNYQNYTVPFAISGGIFPFDIFAASFYLITRYEEYLSTEQDHHNRFLGKNSWAYKNNFLKIPVIDNWAFELLRILKKHFPHLRYKNRKFIFQPTLDIDMPYYLKSEQLIRRILKSTKLLLTGKINALYKDPFDNYKQVLAWDKQFSQKTIYFILMGHKHKLDGIFNKNYKLFYKLVEWLAKNHELGIHPSYQSNLTPGELAAEKAQLERLTGKTIKISRQHYLKLRFPETYINLIKNGISADYTMTFADETGFRASTCTPFFWYDLSNETITDLTIYPTTVMDQTLRLYQKLSPEQAVSEIKLLIENVKKVNGTFISLWHNQSVCDFNEWKNWKNVYIQLLRLAGKV